LFHKKQEEKRERKEHSEEDEEKKISMLNAIVIEVKRFRRNEMHSK
jgi:hypothetical protein